MAVVRSSRTALERILGDVRNVVLFLHGPATPTALARRLHDMGAELELEKPWRQTVLITDLATLTAAENALWNLDEDRFAVWNAFEAHVRLHAPLSELLRASDGEPSIRALRSAFVSGEVAP